MALLKATLIPIFKTRSAFWQDEALKKNSRAHLDRTTPAVGGGEVPRPPRPNGGPGLRGKVISFHILPLDPAYLPTRACWRAGRAEQAEWAGLAGHVPVKDKRHQRFRAARQRGQPVSESLRFRVSVPIVMDEAM